MLFRLGTVIFDDSIIRKYLVGVVVLFRIGVVMWKHKKKVLCLCAAVAGIGNGVVLGVYSVSYVMICTGACVGGHYLVKKIWLTQESERNQQLESIRYMSLNIGYCCNVNVC